MPKLNTDYREDLLRDLVDPEEARYYLRAALEEPSEFLIVAVRDIVEAWRSSKEPQ